MLVAPSLAGESFGMVLIEAMASGTPPVASRIAGYSDVITDGVDGVLVPPANPQALAEELQLLWHEPERRMAMGAEGRISAERYAWPRVAEEVTEVYERAMSPDRAPISRTEAAGRRLGLIPLDGSPRIPAQKLESFDPVIETGSKRRAAVRRIGLGIAAIVGIGLTVLAARRIGVARRRP